MSNEVVPRHIDSLSSLLHTALRRAEDELRRTGDDNMDRPKHTLFSVAFAPELVIAYLARKEAVSRDILIEVELRSKDGSLVDLCSVINGSYTASLEITAPSGIWGSNKPLQEDGQKVLNQCISGVTATEHYNAWILALQDDTTTEALEQLARNAVKGLLDVGECVVSDPIPINQDTSAVCEYNSHRYECLRVIVFNRVNANTSVPPVQIP